MPEFVRLKNKATGAEFTVPAGIEIGDDVTVLDKPATNGEGVPLSPKYKTFPGYAGDEITTTTPSARKAATPPKE